MKTLTVTVTLVLLVVLLVPDTQGWFWSRRRRSCSRVDCAWGGWGGWSGCTASCGPSGTQSRSRGVSRQASCGGSGCSGPSSETRACNRHCYNNGALTSSGCNCPAGYVGGCCETQIVCPGVDPPANGDRSGCSTYGCTLTYSCEEGYELNGVETRTCGGSGSWSDEAPTCSKVACALIDPPTDGAIVGGRAVRFYGDSMTVTCNSGYEMTGSSTRSCQADRSWSGDETACHRVSCGELAGPENGAKFGDSYLYEDVVTFSCNPGYGLQGSADRTCQADRTWSGEEASCTRLPCPVLDSPDNGAVAGDHLFGDVATYSCDTGYELEGVTTRTCQADQTWSDAPSVCNKICCGEPSVANGNVEGTYCYQETVTVSCDEGYRLVGAESLECTATGAWNNEVPICERICCDNTIGIANGQINAEEGYCSGNVIQFSCNTGYELVGSSSATCQLDESWDQEIPICQRVYCGDPGQLRHATRELEGMYYGDAATFTCNTGFNLQGNGNLTCGASAEWEGGEPTCEPNGDCSCDSIASPGGGTATCMGGTVNGEPSQFARMTCPSPKAYPVSENQFECGAATGYLWMMRHFFTLTLSDVLNCQDQSAVAAAVDVSGLMIRATAPVDGTAIVSALKEGLAAQDGFCQSPCTVGTVTLSAEEAAEGSPVEVSATVQVYVLGDTDAIWVTIPDDINVALSTNADALKQLAQASGVSFSAAGQDLILEDGGVSTSDSYITCPEGHELNGFNCYACPAGTYYDSSDSECKSCPFGYYSDQAGQTSCTMCPDGKSTYGEGAKECQVYVDCYCMDGQHPCTFDAQEGWVCHCPAGYQREEDECVVECPTGSSRYGASCFQMNSMRVPYSSASQICRFNGGELPRVKDQGTADFIKELAAGSEVWVGLDDRTDEGQYVWLADGTAIAEGDYTAWASGQPSDTLSWNDCVRMDAEGQWTTINCNDFTAYVCEFN
ncbi:uncharacterized protein LOC144870048 [Branchiostoma floridae x Branchiostoma japonicum]